MKRNCVGSTLVVALAALVAEAPRRAAGFDGSAIVGEHVEVLATGSDLVQLMPTATVAYLRAYDQSQVDMHSATVSWSDFYHQSRANVYDGSNVGHLYLHDSATANIYGGAISWLRLYSSSKVVIKSVDMLSWLLFSGQSEAHLYGSDFRYEMGRLSGKWADGTGFDIWALNSADLPNPEADRSRPPLGLKLHIVPEPSTGVMAVCGLAAGFYLRRRK